MFYESWRHCRCFCCIEKTTTTKKKIVIERENEREMKSFLGNWRKILQPSKLKASITIKLDFAASVGLSRRLEVSWPVLYTEFRFYPITISVLVVTIVDVTSYLVDDDKKEK